MATPRRLSQRVLIADPDAAVRRGLARLLLGAGLDVVTAEDVRAAEALVASSGARVLVAASAIASAFEPRRAAGVSPVLVVLAEPAELAAEAEAFSGRALALVPRGPDAPGLALLVVGALELASARADDRAGASSAPPVEELVASARPMRLALRKLREAAAGDAPVMIVGAPGTGRRTLGRWLHAASGRHGALVTLLAADADAPSLEDALARARHGTLVLEGLEAASPAARRALAEGVPRAHRATSAAPRVITTATPEVRAQRERGELPSELFFALAGVVVDVPSLAARPDDVPVLARIFARRAAERLGVPLPSFHLEALRALRRAPLAEQLPELEGRVTRAVALGASPISARDLGLAPERTAPEPHVDLPYAAARTRALAEFERAYVGAALGRAGGNVARAAHAAGMDRANFRRLIKRIAAGERAALRAEAAPRASREGAEP